LIIPTNILPNPSTTANDSPKIIKPNIKEISEVKYIKIYVGKDTSIFTIICNKNGFDF
jgi:hypothetical protein